MDYMMCVYVADTPEVKSIEFICCLWGSIDFFSILL